MEQNRRHYNWAFLGVLMSIASFWTCVLLMLAVLLTGCATKKELHEEQVRTIVADMLGRQQQTDTHVGQRTENVDSLVTASVWQAIEEYASRQTEKETTTETVTTWVDSLGREMRQEQRTTQRELSRQEQQRQQQMIEQWQSQTERRIRSLDSAWSCRLQEVESHLRDSLAAQRNLISQTGTSDGLGWWQKAWARFQGVIIGAVLAVLIILTRKWWSRIVKTRL